MFHLNYVALCNAIGKSPSAVAEELGLSRATVTHWSDGSVPRQATLQKVADYFGVSVDDLLAEGIKKSTTVSGDVSELSDLQREAWDAIRAMDDDTLRAFITLARAKAKE